MLGELNKQTIMSEEDQYRGQLSLGQQLLSALNEAGAELTDEVQTLLKGLLVPPSHQNLNAQANARVSS